MGAVLKPGVGSTIQDVERALGELQGLGACDLLVPSSLKHSQFGGRVAYLQLLLTWARRCPGNRILLYPNTKLENFIKYDHGLVAALLGNPVYERGANICLTSAIDPLLRRRLKAMQTVDGAQRGQKVFFVCADHANHFAPRRLHHPSIAPSFELRKSDDDFGDFARDVLNAIVRERLSRRIRFDEQIVMDMGSVLKELLQNAEDWGTRDAEESGLVPSIRGMRLEQHSHSHNLHEDFVTGIPVLQQYLAHPEVAGTGPQQEIVEVSVFDGGPGIVARRMKLDGLAWDCHRGTNIDVRIEHDQMVQCIRLHYSSNPGTHRGVGLDQVMQMLSKLRGFLRIRSGRLALQRDFVAEPYHGTMKEEPFLSDWTGLHEPVEAPMIVGTAFTMLFPVRFASGC